MTQKKKHDDTSIAIPLTIEEALKRVVKAGPYPEEKKGTTRPSRSSRGTNPPAPQSDQAEK